MKWCALPDPLVSLISEPCTWSTVPIADPSAPTTSICSLMFWCISTSFSNCRINEIGQPIVPRSGGVADLVGMMQRGGNLLLAQACAVVTVDEQRDAAAPVDVPCPSECIVERSEF